MKILNLSQYYYPVISNGCFFGGGEEVTYNIHSVLKRNNIDVTTCSTMDCDKFCDNLIYYNSYSKHYIKENVNKNLKYFTLKNDFFKTINFKEYDVFLVHTNSTILSFLEKILLRASEKLVIAYIHDNPGLNDLSKLEELKKVYSNLKISVLSDAIKTYVNNKYENLIDYVIGNFFLELKPLNSNNSEIPTLPKSNYLAYIGRFDKSKNYDFLLKFRKYNKNLLFITKPSDSDYIEKNQITLFKNKNEEDLIAFLFINKDKIKLIVPGIEAFSNIAFKCQQLGIPVFYIKHKDAPDSISSYVIQDVTGKGFDLKNDVEKEIIDHIESGTYSQVQAHITSKWSPQSKDNYLVNGIKSIYNEFYGK